MKGYRRRPFHRRHVGMPIMDARNRNRYKPTYQPKWVTIGIVAGFWFLGWVVIRAAIQ